MSLSLAIRRPVPPPDAEGEGWLERLRRCAGRGDVLGVLRVMAAEWASDGATLQCCDVVGARQGGGVLVASCRWWRPLKRASCDLSGRKGPLEYFDRFDQFEHVTIQNKFAILDLQHGG